MPSPELLDRLPPHNLDAEKGVLGSIILEPGRLDEVTNILQPNDFHAEANKLLYIQLIELHDQRKRIDATLILERLQASGRLVAVGGSAYIAEVLHAVPYAANAVHYAKIIAKNALWRRLIAAGCKLVQSGYEANGEPEVTLDAAESLLSEIRLQRSDSDPVTASEAALAASKHIDEVQKRGHGAGIGTGLLSYDTDQGGLFPGELVILAARPACGKTSLAMQIAQHNAMRGRLVYFASLEMSSVELSIRMACGDSGVSNRIIRTGNASPENLMAMAKAFAAQSGIALDIHDRSSLTVAAIRREIRKRIKRGIQLAVIDYLQLITPEDRKLPREQQVARMVRQLKETAREYKIPILVLCQLNRQAEANEQPALYHLRESGSIEQDADVVWFLHQHKDKEGEGFNAVLTIAKNRNGETGPLKLVWDGSRTRFSVPGHSEFTEFGVSPESW